MEPGVLDSPAKHIDLLPKLRLAKRRFALRKAWISATKARLQDRASSFWFLLPITSLA
jgi:hypothetical protein